MKQVRPDIRHALVVDTNSRQNKIWIAISLIAESYWLEWKWAGESMRSRLLFRFDPADKFVEARSYDEDVKPKLKFAKDG